MDRKDILKQFDLLADKKWAKDKNHINVINSKKPIIGVRTADMKALAKKMAKSDLQGAILALKSEYFEEILLKGFLIGYVGDIDKTYGMLLDFLPQIDNWAICDQTCAGLKVFDKDKENEYFDKFIELSKNKKEFYARVGIIMLMTYYLKPECIDYIFEVLTEISSHDYYVDMAVAWLVSVAFVKHEEQTLEFLASKKLQKRVQNKAICKIRDSFRVEKCKKELVKTFRI